MSKEILRVDFQPDDRHPSRTPARDDFFWSVIGALAIVAAVVVFVKLLPFMLAVLAASAVLAAISTWKSARRREIWRRHGWPAAPVGVKTYLGFLAAWFLGLLAVVPLFLIGAVVATAVLVVICVVAVVALLSSLFRSS